ncbi:F-box-like/WD repeat-containing protein TBL1XR1 [Grifola frondosa]|uniref:F-box-like/WD repeat-containing protein TBL1XR1 n=1 Tax=Grifola frondosa TaxID=5627 RepID=A0A1C7LUX2_GRIFR|nr:F-box-like/WD repeat-containing protein TBL1XR1 [Grifola frondosa]
MTVPFQITADEVNCLIYAYFQDSGFQHSAFVLRMEGRLDHSPHFKKHVPRGELIELLSKALLYSEVESHWRSNAMTANCTNTFRLLERHVCSLDPSLPATVTFNPPPLAPLPIPQPAPVLQTNGTGNADSASKRKASMPAMDDVPREKRAKTSTPENDNDADSIASSVDSKPVKKPKLAAAASNAPTAGRKKPDTQLPAATDLSKLDPVILLKGHKSEVFVCAWNPAKRSTLASGSRDTTVHIWNVPETKPDGSDYPPHIDPPITLAHSLKTEQGDLTSLDWNRDGSLLAIGSYDATLRVCNASGQMYFSHTQHEKGPIFATRFSKALHKQYHCHKDCCLDVDWLTETMFASCGADGKIQIINLENSQPLKTLTGHSTEVNQIKCNPSRSKIASCSDDQTARVWNIEGVVHSRPQKNEVVVLRGHTQTVSSIAWCPVTAKDEHETLATSSFDGTSRLWDSVTGECLRVFSDHKRHVYALVFSPDGRFFATGGGDGWLHVYDVKAREKRWSWYAGPEKPGIFEIDWQQSEDLNRLALALESCQVGVVDLTKVPLLR